MKAYHEMLEYVLAHGKRRTDRTGTGTISVFSMEKTFDLQESLPLVTTKALHLRSIIGELLWFISGSTNVKHLVERAIRIWNEWADEDGELGPVYGKQWRNVDSAGTRIDQLQNAIDLIRNCPDSRRIIVSAWNVGELSKMRLPPCHILFQFYVDGDTLDCKLYQRSADMFLGVPYNIASYAILTHMIAKITGLKPGRFIWSGGDCHIYVNHLDQVQEQLSRPFPEGNAMININAVNGQSIDSIRFEDIEITGYNPLPAIKAPVAV